MPSPYNSVPTKLDLMNYAALSSCSSSAASTEADKQYNYIMKSLRNRELLENLKRKFAKLCAWGISMTEQNMSMIMRTQKDIPKIDIVQR